jgi:hypothetical protein
VAGDEVEVLIEDTVSCTHLIDLPNVRETAIKDAVKAGQVQQVAFNSMRVIFGEIWSVALFGLSQFCLLANYRCSVVRRQYVEVYPTCSS